MLWLIAGVIWAGWRVWAREDRWYGDVLQPLLFVFAGILFIAAEASASYKHPARLIAWEWLVLFVVYCLVRQTTVSRQEQHGLYNAMLATMLTLAVYSTYQVGVELPALAAQLEQNPGAVQAEFARQNPILGVSDTGMENIQKRIQDRHAFATFSHPNTFASFLILFLPGLFALAFLAWRDRAGIAVRVLALAGFLLGMAGLWLTHSRGGMLAIALVGASSAAIIYRTQIRAHFRKALVATLALAAVVIVVWVSGFLTQGLGKSTSTAAYRLDYWRNTGELIRDHWLAGVGPGNFGRIYPRYMEPTDLETVGDPHNFLLETWATAGIFALAVVVLLLAAFFWLTRRTAEKRGGGEEGRRGGGEERQKSGDESSISSSPPLRMEFYLGGMFGLILGFVLRALNRSSDEVILEGAAAAGRSIVWFVAFALLDRTPWVGSVHRRVLVAGVAAVFINLLVSGGFGAVSLMTLVVAVMAIAVNMARPTPSRVSRLGHLSVGAPLPIVAAVTLLFYLNVYSPVTSSYSLVARTVKTGNALLQDLAKPPGERTFQLPNRPLWGNEHPWVWVLRRQVVNPLHRAAEMNRGDASVWIHLAYWYERLWEFDPSRSSLPLAQAAIQSAQRVQALDPEHRRGYYTEYELRARFARLVEQRQSRLASLLGGSGYQVVFQHTPQASPLTRQLPEEARKEYGLAAEALRKYIPRDPHNPVIRRDLVIAHFLAGNRVEARKEAELTLQIDRQTPPGPRRLPDQQHQQLEQWVTDTSSSRPLQNEE